ncbi:DUF6236 family protein [Pseudonocardia sp. N23]|uniref:DUF6236 family protein n=1 Tax=Pseudonocardia sp. N23 TaxID=1987376 RepID=UPI0011453F94|nr:DUF6236 family protein [Pseudonocardia sp. N23]
MIPEESWVKRSLLLFDKVSTVYPNYIDEAEDDMLRWLHDEDLWTPTHPGSSISPECIADLEAALLFFADQDEYRVQPHWHPEDPSLTTLRLGKLPSELERELLELHLARRDWDIEGLLAHEETSHILVAIIARHAAAIHSGFDSRFVTSTDIAGSQRYAYGLLPADSLEADQPAGNAVESFNCAELLLDGLIPTPGRLTSIPDVVSFLKDHRNEVLQFRCELDRLVAAAIQSPDPLDAVRSGRQQIESALSDLERAGRGRLRFLLGSASIMLGTAFAAHNLDADTVKWVFDGFGVSAVGAMIGSRIVRGRPQSSPYTYLLRARRTFA